MGLHRVKDKKELWRLKSNCRVWNSSNIEPDIGKPFVIHSPFSGTYYKTSVEEYTNWEIIEEYVVAGNLYIQQ